MTVLDTLLEAEKAKYAKVWTDPKYRVRAHGLELWQRYRGIFPDDIEPAIDIGCGHGRLMAHWCKEGKLAFGLDIVDVLDPRIRFDWGTRLQLKPIWELEGDYALGVAADVLEHIPPIWVKASLEAIASSCRVFVCQTAENKSYFGNGELHLTCEPASWWLDQMKSIGGRAQKLNINCGVGRHVIRWDLS